MRYHELSQVERNDLYLSFCATIGMAPHSSYKRAIKDPYIIELEKQKKETVKIPEWCEDNLGAMSVQAGRQLYDLVHRYSPSLVVETGVARGVSTAYILIAMRNNGVGHLHSVDILPNAGILVNDDLKDRWTFHIGKSQDILPELDLVDIDIFIHDSLHTYSNMLWEFRWAYPRVKEGGLIICHDVHKNDSFFDFVEETGEHMFLLPSSSREFVMGALIKGLHEVKEWELFR